MRHRGIFIIEFETKGKKDYWNIIPKREVFLYNRFKILIRKEFEEIPPAWFEDIIMVFHDFDSNGTTFKYGDEIKKEEIVVNLRHVKTKMNQLARIFQRIK